jgi:hypothetical protein
MAIIILHILNIIFCKLAFNINFKYRRKIGYCLVGCVKVIFSVIKSVFFSNTNLYVNSFIYFINTHIQKMIILHACIIIIINKYHNCQLNIFIIQW